MENNAFDKIKKFLSESDNHPISCSHNEESVSLNECQLKIIKLTNFNNAQFVELKSTNPDMIVSKCCLIIQNLNHDFIKKYNFQIGNPILNFMKICQQKMFKSMILHYIHQVEKDQITKEIIKTSESQLK